MSAPTKDSRGKDGKPPRSGKAGQAGKTGKPFKPFKEGRKEGQGAAPGKPAREGRPDRPDRDGKPGDGKPARAGKTFKAFKAGPRAERPAREDRPPREARPREERPGRSFESKPAPLPRPSAAPKPAPEGWVPRYGTVALVGRPNAGKSTLMNALLAEKLAIVSDKPQTTRHRIVGILSEPRGQLVFYDTPGIHKPQHQMNRNMLKSAQEALADADVVCLIVDAAEPTGSGDEYMLEWVKRAEAPRVLVLNKIDKVAKPKLLPRIADYAASNLFTEIVPISARQEDGTAMVLDILFGLAPEGAAAYDPELLTVHPERFLVTERIREKILEQTGEELPYSTAVTLDRWEERPDGLLEIGATILAEKEGQKKILVGAAGARIKAIGTAARLDLEEFLERKVFLDLNVVHERQWRENRRILAQLESAPWDVDLTELGGASPDIPAIDLPELDFPDPEE